MSTSGLPDEQAIEAATEAIHFRHGLSLDESESIARTALAAIGAVSPDIPVADQILGLLESAGVPKQDQFDALVSALKLTR
jgi:hypothetical protein